MPAHESGRTAGRTSSARRRRVVRGRLAGELEAELEATPAAMQVWFRAAVARGFARGRPAMLRAAGVIVSLAGDPRPRSGAELATMARCSPATVWATVLELEAWGFAPLERYGRNGELATRQTRGRTVAYRKFGTNRVVARFRRVLLTRIGYPRSKDEGARGSVERAESVRTRSKVSKVPANPGLLEAGYGHEQASRDGDADPIGASEVARRAREWLEGRRRSRAAVLLEGEG